MKSWKKLLAIIILPTALLLGAASTQVDLTTQVRNILQVVSGGTGLSQMATHCVVIGQGSAPVHLVCPIAAGDVLTDNGPGNDPSFQAAVSAVNHADNETPVGVINGTNSVFALGHIPIPAAGLNCFLNGVHQASGSDFTLTSLTITYMLPPTSGSALVCSYRF